MDYGVVESKCITVNYVQPIELVELKYRVINVWTVQYLQVTVT